MPVELVEIVNSNGRKGFVAKTSRAAAAYKQPPSARTPDPSAAPGPAEQTVVTSPPTGLEKPAKSASKADWIAYATHDATPNRLSAEQADPMTRDELAEHFNPAEEA